MIKRKTDPQIILYVVLILLALIELAPILVALLNSFRSDSEIKKMAVGLPTQFHFDNYVKAWTVGKYGTAFLNSMVVSVSSSAVILVFALLSGYFISRFRNRFTNLLRTYYGVVLSISVFSFLIPLYFSFAKLRLVNTRLGLIIVYVAVNMSFSIMLATTFISGIPRELDEAAKIDGCSVFQTIGHLILPLAKPIVTTILLIVFVDTWNEFTLSNTFLQIPELKTVATRYVAFVGERGSNMSLVYTAGIITLLPIIILFVSLQNYFIEGMTSGSVK